jgi:uncharacterized repeat protein (TIGR03803 family)
MRRLLLFVTAVFSVLLLPATGDLSARTTPARVTDPASVPAFQKIYSFGEPSPGANPVQLMRGADGALYGTASGGGSEGSGTVFKMNPDGSGFTVLANFVYFTTGANPHCRLVQGPDGTLYGTASAGGSHDYGTIFKLAPDGTGFQSIVNFDEFSLGGVPLAGLVLGSDGLLYGTASEGSLGHGTVFRLNTDGSGFLVLKSFSLAQNGGDVHGELIQGTDGALYGTASQGGSGGNGTVFKLNTNGSGFTVLKSLAFNAATTGAIPEAGLVQGTDGALYGTTSAGGLNGYGTVYKLNTNGTGFLLIKNFDNATSGGYPYGALSQGSDGALYGTATEGGSGDRGTVFKLNPNGTGFAVLENLDGATTGGYPLSVLVQGTGGVLYGAAVLGGGGGGGGTVFSLSSGGTGFAVLKPFPVWPNIPGGGQPEAGLIQGTDGALYGTTAFGGSTDGGTVFKLNPDGSGFTALASLADNTSGSLSTAPLVQGTDGTLYGTANRGGSSGFYGTVFSLDPHGGSLTVLQDFDGVTTGGSPYAGLILGADGLLYGTTSVGGSLGYGTVFSLAQHGGGFTVLLNLDNYTTGGTPSYDGLVQGSDGVLYGTAYRGGTMGYGTVFKLNPDGSGFEVLLAFDGATTGGQPFGGLMLGADGALYGTTSSGGSGGQGTVFKLNRDGSGFMVVQNFDGATTGSRPFAGLVQGSDGTLYGTTSEGGSGSSGTVFQVNPDGSGFEVLQSFDASTNGGHPLGRLIWGTDGNLYGTTWNGGDTGFGTVYRLVFAHGPCAGKADGASCDDGDACTQSDTCQAGACVGGGAVTCAALDQCHDSGVCNPGTGVCSNPAKAEGAACNDENACTQADSCHAGACVGGNPVTCTALDQCHLAGVCNQMTGACTNPARMNGTTCNDGNACTRSDTCQAGACVAGNPVICAAPDQCHDAGACDTGTGICSNPVRPDGSACSDADACTQIDRCQAGVCQGTTYSWSGVLSPLNADGSSIFKLGNTVPVKFKLTGACDGRANVIAHLYLTKYSINIYGTVLEVLPKNKADVGNTFRSDTSGNYSFNLDTGTLSRGTWQLRIDLGDGVPNRTVLFSLK